MNPSQTSHEPETLPTGELIKDALQSTKQALAAGQKAIEDVSQMQRRIEHTLNWRAKIAERPWAVLGIAAAGGFMLSAVYASRSRSRVRG